MSFEDGDLQLLTQIGFTKTQAFLYLKILELEEADARTLAKKTSIPRAMVYRVLDELQRKGLVEKEIGVPHKFRGVPIEFGLQTLMAEHLKQHEILQAKTKKLLRKLQINHKKEQAKPEENKFLIIEGRERILETIRRQHANVQRSVYIMTILPRWLQIIQHCRECYEKALDRNVEYRVIIEKTNFEIAFPEKIECLLKKNSFAIRFYPGILGNNLAIFDQNEVTFNYFPSQSLKESPIIWTNHPSFVLMAQDHFDKVWKSSEEFHLKPSMVKK